MLKTIIAEKLPTYLKAKLPEKTAIISSFCTVSGMHHKAVIRAFAREQKRSNRKFQAKLGRPKKYIAETEAALSFI